MDEVDWKTVFLAMILAGAWLRGWLDRRDLLGRVRRLEERARRLEAGEGDR